MNVYERPSRAPLAELFFVGFEHAGAVKEDRVTVVLLGGLPADDYYKQAMFVPVGGQLNPQGVAENDVWNLRTGDLQALADWLARVERQMR